jgi:hypothetical protein
MIRCLVAGFQLDDTTLFTINNGTELVASGMWDIEWKSPHQIVLGGEVDLRVTVTETCDDPLIVGRIDRPQTRIRWKGFADLSDDELKALRECFADGKFQSANGTKAQPHEGSPEERQQKEMQVIL